MDYQREAGCGFIVSRQLLGFQRTQRHALIRGIETKRSK
jgi:hypothetical protein